MKVAPSAQPIVEQSGGKGIHKVKIERAFYATINGSILIRKGGQ